MRFRCMQMWADSLSVGAAIAFKMRFMLYNDYSLDVLPEGVALILKQLRSFDSAAAGATRQRITEV